MERTTFNITIVNNNTTNGIDNDMIQNTSSDLENAKTSTDERFHNVSSTFNTTQQLILQEQERMERELSTTLGGDDDANDSQDNRKELANKGMKSRNPSNPITNARSDSDHDDSDSSGDDDDDDLDDDNVNPLQRLATTVVPSVSRHNDMITGDEDENDDDSDSSSSEESSKADYAGSTNDAAFTQMTTSQKDVLDMATNLRKLASQKGKPSNNTTNNISGEMEEEDDFFVALDESNDNIDEHDSSSKHINVFANAKRDTIRYNRSGSNNGIGDKSQGWSTQKQLPGQFRKKQRRRWKVGIFNAMIILCH